MMKKIIFVFALSVLISASALAQNVGLYAGTNLANLKVDIHTTNTDTSYKFGLMPTYAGGLMMEFVLVDEAVYLQMNMEAMGKGALDSVGDRKNKTVMHFVQASFGPKYRLYFSDENSWFIGAYGYAGYSYLGKTIQEGQDDYELNFGTDVLKDDYNGLDYGASFDTGFAFSGFNIGYRYNLPLANIQTADDNEFKIRHSSQMIYLAYFFSQD